MEAIEVRDDERDTQNKQYNVRNDEVRTPKREFDYLDDELASWLRHHVRSQASAIPSTRPPGTIGFIVFELARQER